MIKLIIAMILIVISIISAEESFKQLYCELNNFARERVANNQPVFPCEN